MFRSDRSDLNDDNMLKMLNLERLLTGQMRLSGREAP